MQGEFCLDNRFYILTAAFLALASLDIITTTYILAHGGYEANPFLVNIVGSPWKHIAVKGIVCGLVLGIAVKAGKWVENADVIIMAIVTLEFCLPVVSNLTQILLS